MKIFACTVVTLEDGALNLNVCANGKREAAMAARLDMIEERGYKGARVTRVTALPGGAGGWSYGQTLLTGKAVWL